MHSHSLKNDQKHYQRQELLSIVIIEAEICFHSIFIGLSLAVTTGAEYTALLIAIVFHQVGSAKPSVVPDGCR